MWKLACSGKHKTCSHKNPSLDAKLLHFLMSERQAMLKESPILSPSLLAITITYPKHSAQLLPAPSGWGEQKHQHSILKSFVVLLPCDTDVSVAEKAKGWPFECE